MIFQPRHRPYRRGYRTVPPAPALAAGNQAYEKKFGYIFIVCATGKTAREMLSLLQERLDNDQKEEIIIAIEEQRKITKIRLKKLLS